MEFAKFRQRIFRIKKEFFVPCFFSAFLFIFVSYVRSIETDWGSCRACLRTSLEDQVIRSSKGCPIQESPDLCLVFNPLKVDCWSDSFYLSSSLESPVGIIRVLFLLFWVGIAKQPIKVIHSRSPLLCVHILRRRDQKGRTLQSRIELEHLDRPLPRVVAFVNAVRNSYPIPNSASRIFIPSYYWHLQILRGSTGPIYLSIFYG